MSKLGKKPINVPKETKIQVLSGKFLLNGPKGSKEVIWISRMVFPWYLEKSRCNWFSIFLVAVLESAGFTGSNIRS